MPNILGKILFIITLSIFLNANSSFTLNLSKDKVYVGEAIKATLTLTYDLESPIMRTDFDEFLASNFWIKELEESEPIKKGETTYINYTFLIFPQISGNLTIEPQHLRTAIREAKTNLIIWSDNYTQEKVIEVSPLPENLHILGNYTIEAKLDKTTVNANQAINLTLNLKGDGNFNDIKAFKLSQKEQLTFSTKPVITTNFEDNKYKGVFTQKFSIIADKDFIIPPISFNYFNTETKMIEIIQTKQFKIIVKNNKSKIVKDESYIKYIYAIIGFILGIFTLYIFNYLKNRAKKEDLPLNIKIKKTKNDKQLYEVLLPYVNNIELSETMKKLEENIYNNGKNKIDKSKVFIKSYCIKS